MTEPRTEAGRILHNEVFGYGTCDGSDNCPAAQSIRAIEDEAVRKERERIEAALESLWLQPDSNVVPMTIGQLRAVLAAITDTGEGSAS